MRLQSNCSGDTLSSEATATSERFIVWKLFTYHNPDLTRIAYYLQLFHAKFQHLKSNSLASITFSSKKPHLAKQLFISDLNGGLPLYTYIVFQLFELKFWGWTQITAITGDHTRFAIIARRAKFMRFFIVFQDFSCSTNS